MQGVDRVEIKIWSLLALNSFETFIKHVEQQLETDCFMQDYFFFSQQFSNEDTFL